MRHAWPFGPGGSILLRVLDAAVAGAHLEFGLQLEVARRAALPDDERVRVDDFLRRALADDHAVLDAPELRVAVPVLEHRDRRSAAPPAASSGCWLTCRLRSRCRRLALFGRSGLRVGARRQALAVEHALEAGAVFEGQVLNTAATSAAASLGGALAARRCGRRGLLAGRWLLRASSQPRHPDQAGDDGRGHAHSSRAPAIQFVHSHLVLQHYWRGAPPPRLGPRHKPARGVACLLQLSSWSRGPTPAPRARATHRRGVSALFFSVPSISSPCARSSKLLARGPTPAPRARATNRRGVSTLFFSVVSSSSPCPRS